MLLRLLGDTGDAGLGLRGERGCVACGGAVRFFDGVVGVRWLTPGLLLLLLSSRSAMLLGQTASNRSPRDDKEEDESGTCNVRKIDM